MFPWQLGFSPLVLLRLNDLSNWFATEKMFHKLLSLFEVNAVVKDLQVIASDANVTTFNEIDCHDWSTGWNQLPTKVWNICWRQRTWLWTVAIFGRKLLTNDFHELFEVVILFVFVGSQKVYDVAVGDTRTFFGCLWRVVVLLEERILSFNYYTHFFRFKLEW